MVRTPCGQDAAGYFSKFRMIFAKSRAILNAERDVANPTAIKITPCQGAYQASGQKKAAILAAMPRAHHLAQLQWKTIN